MISGADEQKTGVGPGGGGGACQTKRANVASPQAHSGQLETDPESAREEPR